MEAGLVKLRFATVDGNFGPRLCRDVKDSDGGTGSQGMAGRRLRPDEQPW